MSELRKQIIDILAASAGSLIAETILESGCRRCKIDSSQIADAARPQLMAELQAGVKLFIHSAAEQQKCFRKLEELLQLEAAAPPASDRIQRVEINEERDVVAARSNARTICKDMGFHLIDQTKVATVVSELARNIIQYAGSGIVELSLLGGPRSGIRITAMDQGSGIEDLDLVLSGAYQSRTGLGKGLQATKKIMDRFEIDTGPDRGTTVTIEKYK